MNGTNFLRTHSLHLNLTANDILQTSSLVNTWIRELYVDQSMSMTEKFVSNNYTIILSTLLLSFFCSLNELLQINT